MQKEGRGWGVSFGGTPTDRAGEGRGQGRPEGSIERVGFQGPLLGSLDMPKSDDVTSGAVSLVSRLLLAQPHTTE